ncbi:MAG: hypothetical protein KDA28_08400, partial [Phycisphaerales bacterium]|nr:hypothetical protein [Phycisphaerales bacterium]
AAWEDSLSPIVLPPDPVGIDHVVDGNVTFDYEDYGHLDYDTSLSLLFDDPDASWFWTTSGRSAVALARFLMEAIVRPGGFVVSERAYRPGERTTWESDDHPFGRVFEIAYLGPVADETERRQLTLSDAMEPSDDEALVVVLRLARGASESRVVEAVVRTPDRNIPMDAHVGEDVTIGATPLRDSVSMQQDRVDIGRQHLTADMYTIYSDPPREVWVANGNAVPGGIVRVITSGDAGNVLEYRLVAFDNDASAQVLRDYCRDPEVP